MELIYIEWEDASAVDTEVGWVFKDDAPVPERHTFKQVGFVVDADLDAIILTEAYSKEQFAPRTRIPLGMIRRWVDLTDTVKEPV